MTRNIDVDVAVLKNIIETVTSDSMPQTKGAVPAVLSFHRPGENVLKNCHDEAVNPSSKYLSQSGTPNGTDECPFCFKALAPDKRGTFCEYCGALIINSYEKMI